MTVIRSLIIGSAFCLYCTSANAAALTREECVVKYKAAMAAKTHDSWVAFQEKKCGTPADHASPTPPAAKPAKR